MKAISIRQPWADWVVKGKITLELRTWTVSYRGSLAIHASQTIQRDVCLSHGIDPDQLTTGAIIGTADLVDIISIGKDAFTKYQNQHLATGFFRPSKQDETVYGWRLENARQLPEPVPYRGRMGLFDVPESAFEDESQDGGDLKSGQATLEWDARQAFELRVVAMPPGKARPSSYRLALYQRYVKPPPKQAQMNIRAPVKMRLVAELGGDALKAVADQILDALRENGYQATDLKAGRREPFYLAEEFGVRLGLLFLAIRPLTKWNRVEMISQGLRQMTGEELYYWYSKCTNTQNAERGQKALRMLLSDE